MSKERKSDISCRQYFIVTVLNSDAWLAMDCLEEEVNTLVNENKSLVVCGGVSLVQRSADEHLASQAMFSPGAE